VFAVDAASGERRWSADLPGAVAGPVIADGDTLFVGTFDRKLRALDAASEGAERWAFQGGSWFWSRPLVEPGSVYAASVRGQVVALDPATGEQQWETALDRGEVRAAPVLLENTLVIATRDGYLVGLDPANGAQRWEHSLTEERLLANPLVLDARILYLTDQGTLVRLNPADGQVEQLYRRE
jgi:outer membrane protein assembly factor BamB